MIGAIVIVESEAAGGPSTLQGMLEEPRSLACVEVLGRSALDRTVDRLRASGITAISLLGIRSGALEQQDNSGPRASSVWQCATGKIVEMSRQRVSAALIVVLGGYIEFSPSDLVQFQQEQGAPVVRACDENGALPVWLIASARLPQDAALNDYLRDTQPVLFELGTYVNHLKNARDLRRLVVDGLTSRCNFRPAGFEVKPGVWMAQGAQVARGARVVAPAFIGQDVRVADQCLITRYSNLECGSQIDYGTVVEDSSVLSATYVGIGLDLSHSIVDGSHLANLRHDVTLEISDPAILRRVHKDRAQSAGRRHLLANFEFDEGAASPAQMSKR